jgi:hypothetical protein
MWEGEESVSDEKGYSQGMGNRQGQTFLNKRKLFTMKFLVKLIELYT